MAFRTSTRAWIVTVGLGWLLIAGWAGPAGSRTQEPDWTLREEMLLFYEASTKIGRLALEPPPAREMVREAIGYLAVRLDPYSGYLTPPEFEAFNRASTGSYEGVGMDLAQERSGGMVCIPFPGGPAEAAGIRYGQALLEVDGRPVKGRSVYSVGAAIRGPAGTQVELTLEGGEGPVRIRVTRQTIRFRSVLVRTGDHPPILRIIRFTPGTPAELTEALDGLRPETPLIIDLRGNTGGDLPAAIDSAGLFLDRGQKIVDLITREGERTYRSPDHPALFKGRLFLWQDDRTASAAEVFLAALSQNGRGETLGWTSFGKGLAQKVAELSDGSALIVTYASLRPPNGRPFEGRGLRPDHPLNQLPLPFGQEVAERLLLNLVRGLIENN